MEPAAPVTSTTLPSSVPRIWSSSRCTGSRPEQILDGHLADLSGETVSFNHLG